MTHRCLVVVAIVLWAVAAPARAQDPAPAAPQVIRFMPRYDFHLSADHLSTDDARFVWDTNFGGEVDFVDYGVGRATFTGNFESVLGNQFRDFDPNQGNYLLDGSVSLRERGTEVAMLFHHTSRHLSDRFKRAPVGWNMLGARVRHNIVGRKAAIQLKGDLLAGLVKNNVDYNWEADGDVRVAVPLRPAVSVITSARLQLIGVDGSQQRGTQTGSRAEVGIRLAGEKGAIELIVAAERRVDPYPLEFSTLNWVSAGFRFVSR
ncbi:MAG TPA: hypothetical protein VFU28_24895 [Vicinamibacterales bacterium]|nr:hypothetical protein [Vicinamibacterales bacterium]